MIRERTDAELQAEEERKRIVQIMPAEGWRAMYAQDNGSTEIWPLVAWGLSAEGYMVPLDSDCDGCVDAADDASNFVGLLNPREPDEDAVGRTREYRERKAKQAARAKP